MERKKIKNTVEAKLVKNITGALSEYEKTLRSECIKEGLRKKKANCSK